MDSSEEKLDELEAEFPLLSGKAFADAQAEALKSGLPVLVAQNGQLVRHYPDGSEEFVKVIEASVAVRPGTKIKIHK